MLTISQVVVHLPKPNHGAGWVMCGSHVLPALHVEYNVIGCSRHITSWVPYAKSGVWKYVPEVIIIIGWSEEECFYAKANLSV